MDAATPYAENEPQVVEEVMDVRHASRLSPSYLFQDVRWGYGATSNKLATACTNGAVILWDLSRDGGSSKLGQFDTLFLPLSLTLDAGVSLTVMYGCRSIRSSQVRT